jgi:hypothetical protein
MPLDDVLVMGKARSPSSSRARARSSRRGDVALPRLQVQPLQLLDKIASVGPAPEWAYPTWSPRVGVSFKIAYISSDLLRNHPVGNMMRAVLPLPPPVLTGHVSSLLPYKPDTSLPSFRTNWTRLGAGQVLPLHDFSRMDVTLYVIHVHQAQSPPAPPAPPRAAARRQPPLWRAGGRCTRRSSPRKNTF